MQEIVRIVDTLELSREFINRMVSNFYNEYDIQVPEINGLIKTDYNTSDTNISLRLFLNDKFLNLFKVNNDNNIITFTNPIKATQIEADELIISRVINQKTIDQLNVTDKEIMLNAGDTSVIDNPVNDEYDSFISTFRGSLNKVSIKWNEIINRWQFTNNGTTYSNFINYDPVANAYLNIDTGSTGFYINDNAGLTVNKTDKPYLMYKGTQWWVKDGSTSTPNPFPLLPYKEFGIDNINPDHFIIINKKLNLTSSMVTMINHANKNDLNRLSINVKNELTVDTLPVFDEKLVFAYNLIIG